MSKSSAVVATNRRDREPAISLWLYRMFKWPIIMPIYSTYFRGRRHGLKQVPQKGRLLVVCNHASDLDPFIVGSCLDRPVSFMAKQELFEVPGLKQFITLYGAYPVKRGAGDRAAMRAAINAVETGWATGVFLDGTRTADGRIHDPKLGAAWISAHTQATILPVCLWGSHGIWPKGSSAKLPASVPLTFRVGTMIPPPATTKRHDLEAVTQQCAEAINGLHDLGR
jgi:1-acyl-sn-glycerol-3-phosphate acyltransferase